MGDGSRIRDSKMNRPPDLPELLHEAYDDINGAGLIAHLLTDPDFAADDDDRELREHLLRYPKVGKHYFRGGLATTAEILAAHERGD